MGDFLHIHRERPHPLGAVVQCGVLRGERRNVRIELDERHFKRRVENRERKADGTASRADVGDAAFGIGPSRRDDERGIRADAVPEAELAQHQPPAEKAFLVKAFGIFSAHAEP